MWLILFVGYDESISIRSQHGPSTDLLPPNCIYFTREMGYCKYILFRPVVCNSWLLVVHENHPRTIYMSFESSLLKVALALLVGKCIRCKQPLISKRKTSSANPDTRFSFAKFTHAPGGRGCSVVRLVILVGLYVCVYMCVCDR